MTIDGDAHRNIDVVRLMAWLSPSFPVGAYTYSHGIEYAIEAGLIGDRETLSMWISHILTHGSGRSDCVLARAAHDAVRAGDVDQFSDVATWADVYRSSPEMALESVSQGAAFLETAAAAWSEINLPPWRANLDAIERPAAYAVALGLVSALSGIPIRLMLSAFLHAFAANLISAGVRLVPLGQTDGQRATADLERTVLGVADEVAAIEPIILPDHLGTAAPMVDWTSIQHETQYTRLFRS